VFHVTGYVYHLIYAAELGFYGATTAFALWRGDGAARWAAAILAVFGVPAAWATASVPALQAAPALDLACLVALAGLALRRPRPWLTWVCAFQLAALATHAARALDPHIGTLAFQTAFNSWWMLQTAALLRGAWEAHRARPAPPR
jgi:hypothetical protein